MKQLEMLLVWLLFFASSVFGHVALKQAAGVSDRFDYARLWQMWKDPWALAAIASWTLSCLLWALLLTRFGVAEASSHSAIRYVGIVLAAVLFFREPLTAKQAVGMILITAGIWLTAKA